MLNAEIHREIWQGRLPLCFNINSDDIIGMYRPEPYFMMVSRVTYFPLILDRVVKYFDRFVDQSNKDIKNELWLDYDGQPIKWHHPIGLSWDLFGSSSDLPWRLILHFSKFPTEELVRCSTKESIEACFMNCVKEADALKHRSSVMRNLVKKECNQLWSGLVNDKFEHFWQVNKKLMERTDDEPFKSIPFRLHFPDSTYVQKLVRPYTTEGHKFHNSGKQTTSSDSPQDIHQLQNNEKDLTTCAQTDATLGDNSMLRSTTLLDLIEASFSDRIDDLTISQSKVAEYSRNPDDRSQKIPNDLIDVENFKYRFLTHGIEIPFDAPLQWLSENLSYPDNFLHICAVPKP